MPSGSVPCQSTRSTGATARASSFFGAGKTIWTSGVIVVLVNDAVARGENAPRSSSHFTATVWKPRARVAAPELTLSERKMNFSRFAVVFTHTVSAFARLGGSTVYQK